MVSFWCLFVVILASFWCHLDLILLLFWCHFGVILVSCQQLLRQRRRRPIARHRKQPEVAMTTLNQWTSATPDDADDASLHCCRPRTKVISFAHLHFCKYKNLHNGVVEWQECGPVQQILAADHRTKTAVASHRSVPQLPLTVN